MEVIQTEDHIKQTAKKVFFSKGHLDAKTQEIADEAGVNRALIHYYFRTREKLFDTVLKDAMEEAFKKMFSIMTSDLEFETKIEQMVSSSIDRMIEYPYIEAFIISEMVKKPETVKMLPLGSKKDKSRMSFEKEVEAYIKLHNLPHINPQHFVANMMSMCAYPSVSKSILKHLLEYNDEQYTKFLLERKTIITNLLLGRK